jgi:MFS transporter, DHA1 family, multidrug resistance protein
VLTRGFIVLWIAMLVAMAGVSMVTPLLPVVVQEDLGGPPIGVALSFSGLAAAQLIASPFAGRLGDRFGPKPWMVAGFCVYGLGAVGYLFATTWEVVVAFRVLSGIGAAGVFPMALAYVGRLAPEGAEGRTMGVFAVAQVVGFGSGPIVGGGLRDAFGSDAAFGAMALMLGATALLTLLFLPSRPQRRGDPADAPNILAPALPLGQIIRRPGVQAAMLFVVLTALGWGAAGSWLAVFVVSDEGLGTDSALFVGVLFAARAFIHATLQPWTGSLADRKNRIVLVALGLSISGIAQMSIPLVPAHLIEATWFGPAVLIAPWVLAALVLAGVAESLAFPAQQALFVQLGRRVGMGSLMGLNSMGSSAGFLAGSLLGALVKGTLGLEAVFIVAGIVTLAGVAIFLLLARRAGDELRPEGAPA